MPSADSACGSSDAGRSEAGQRMQAVRKFKSQSIARLTYGGWRCRGPASAFHREPAACRLYIELGENGKRYQLHQQASTKPCWPVLILTISHPRSAPARLIRLQQRCNLDPRRGGAYTYFSTEFAIWRGRWRRPCVKYRFNSYTSRGLTAACRLYIQNEGLRENFWEDRANEDTKRCCSPFINGHTASAVCHDLRRGRGTAY
jgi:hypothetical protein